MARTAREKSKYNTYLVVLKGDFSLSFDDEDKANLLKIEQDEISKELLDNSNEINSIEERLFEVSKDKINSDILSFFVYP